MRYREQEIDAVLHILKYFNVVGRCIFCILDAAYEFLFYKYSALCSLQFSDKASSLHWRC
jgi:hypothetical protein